MTQHSQQVTVATATRPGDVVPNCDATAVFTTSDLVTAAAVVDGIGHSEKIAECAQLLAQTAARIGARRLGLAGLLAAGQLIADAGPNELDPEPDAVAVIAVAAYGEDTRVAWVGDCRVYGWDGDQLRQYSTDHTIGHQLRLGGAPQGLAQNYDPWLRTSLALAVVGTVCEATVPEPLVILTSDGIHDSVPHDELMDLVRRHQSDPQTLADALVAAARADQVGYRDDATAVVILTGDPRPEPLPLLAHGPGDEGAV